MSERSDLDILADLGVEPIRKTKPAMSPREARIIAGFEDIQKFVEEHGHPPQHGEDRDIFERLYAVRLDRLRAQPDCVELLRDLDHQGLLNGEAAEAQPDEMDDDALLAALGVPAEPENDITTLRHVRSRRRDRAAEEIADRPLRRLRDVRPAFEALKADLAEGRRPTRRFERKSEIEQGRFFIVDGLTAYVAEAGDGVHEHSGNRDRRLRVIFDNGTESNLLARSLQKALTQDPAGRRIIDPDAGPLFSTAPSRGRGQRDRHDLRAAQPVRPPGDREQARRHPQDRRHRRACRAALRECREGPDVPHGAGRDRRDVPAGRYQSRRAGEPSSPLLRAGASRHHDP